MAEVRADPSARAALIEKHLAFLQKRLDDTERHWNALPQLFGFAALAIPAWIVFGFGYAVLAVVLTLALVGTAAYLRGVRRNDIRTEIRMLESDLAKLREQPRA